MNIYFNAQRGAALLALSISIVTTSAALLAMNMATRSHQGRVVTEMQNLNEIKSALLAYSAVNTPNRGPGRLPCPDTNGLGIASNNCSSQSRGLIPTRSAHDLWQLHTLDIPRNKVHFVLDRNFQDRTDGGGPDVNTLTSANLSLDSSTDLVAAIIIGGDWRRGNSNMSNSINQSESQFSRKPGSTTGTIDYVLTISRDELMGVASYSVSVEIKKLLDTYHSANGSYPASIIELENALITMPLWFKKDKWDKVLNYQQLNSDNYQLSYQGCNIIFTGSINSSLQRDSQVC